MIYANYHTTNSFWVTTQEKRITDRAKVPNEYLRFLFKFKSDMSGEVIYAYPQTDKNHINFRVLNDRYTKCVFYSTATKTTPNAFNTTGINSQVNFKPRGYWYYWIYEIAFIDEVGATIIPPAAMATGNLPMNEDGEFWDNDILTPNGKVQGLVEEGKMFIDDARDAHEVTYQHHPEPSGTNYIYTT